jgi:hypothetical protein
VKYVALITFFFTIGSVAKSDDDVERFLQNYPLLTRGQFSVIEESGLNQKTNRSQRSETKVHVDVPRWKIAIKSTFVEFKDGKNQTQIDQYESLWSDNYKQSISVDNKGIIDGGISAYVKTLPASEYRRSFQSVMSYVTEGRTQWNDMRTFKEIFSESNSTITKTTETMQEKRLIVIKIMNPWGTHQFWVDPARNHVLMKMVQEKTINDFVTEGKALSQIRRGATDAPAKSIVMIRDEYVTQKTGLLNNKHYVSQFQRFMLTKYDDGTETKFSNTFTLNNVKQVDSWPKDPFVFTARIPDGTRVTAHDCKPIEYEWRKGAVVKKVNTGELEALETSDFVKPQSSSYTRIAILVAILSLFACVIAWLTIKKVKGKH